MSQESFEEFEVDELIQQLQAQIKNLVGVCKIAVQLSSIATDWNLNEVEIDGEMRSTYDLHKIFIEAVNNQGREE